MDTSVKIVARKANLKSISNCQEISIHNKNESWLGIKEIDLSHNSIL